MAIGSSSRNTTLILERIGLSDEFDAVVDGNQIAKSKPDPQVFLLAAQELGVAPGSCLIVEDAVAGVDAAVAAGMHVAAVGSAAGDSRADLRGPTLAAIADEILVLVAAS